MEIKQNFFLELAKKENYSPITFRVLFHFFDLSVNKPSIKIDAKRITKNLNVSWNSVNRALKQLIEDNIVIKYFHNSKKIDYYLNPKSFQELVNSFECLNLETKSPQLEMVEESEIVILKPKLTELKKISKSELSKERKKQDFLKKLRERY